jgi:6-phosphogluconolactonase
VSGPPQTQVLEDARALADAAAEQVAQAIESAVRERGACYLALAGGETPRGCFETLARPPLRESTPWGRCFVYWSDERFVPLDDPASNYRMAREALLDRVAIPGEQIFPAPVGAPSPKAAAEGYARELERLPRSKNGWPRFDLILLGMGEDGHTASLFPGDPALEERQATVAAVRGSKPPPDRLTFTLPVLNAARLVIFLVQGEGKREALARVLRRDRALPAARVEPVEGEVRFLVDRAAAPGGDTNTLT